MEDSELCSSFLNVQGLYKGFTVSLRDPTQGYWVLSYKLLLLYFLLIEVDRISPDAFSANLRFSSISEAQALVRVNIFKDSLWTVESWTSPKAGVNLKILRSGDSGHVDDVRPKWSLDAFFPTCQVRVVRFYVSIPPPSPPPPPPSSPPPPPTALRCPSVASMWCAGPQPRSCEFSVACRTSTTILWVQCGVPDLNRDPVSSVWRAGPQPRSCEFSVACRTSTVILWVQCGVPDLNCDPVSSVWRAGPQPRSCEFSVACRASTAILWVQCGVPDLK